jgi:glycosyltransferase involved in cell wall biosynthesis
VKFCMVTTFFGAHSFGGDAAYVERLSRALCRAGHEVHIFHCVDAFNAVRGRHPLRSYEPPPGLHIHPLRSRYGIMSPLATQMTGRPHFKAEALASELNKVDTDVIHFHNISLVGGPEVLHLGRDSVRVMTAHEHWLICQMHLLWKYDRQRWSSSPGLAIDGRDPTRARGTGRTDLSQPPCDGRACRSGHQGSDGSSALLPARRLARWI